MATGKRNKRKAVAVTGFVGWNVGWRNRASRKPNISAVDRHEFDGVCTPLARKLGADEATVVSTMATIEELRTDRDHWRDVAVSAQLQVEAERLAGAPVRMRIIPRGCLACLRTD